MQSSENKPENGRHNNMFLTGLIVGVITTLVVLGLYFMPSFIALLMGGN